MALLLDADDTLWENIRVFHDVNRSFAAWLAPEDPAAMLVFADSIQQEFVGIHGYGSATYRLALLETVHRHRGTEPDAEAVAVIDDLVAPFEWHSVEVRPGVAETLEVLGTRHSLLLVTKGQEAEQLRKLEVSGLGHHFDGVHVLDRKTVARYTELIERLRLDPSRSWMIGNSPSSDIVPALQAGLGAVHIPHPDTWEHEDGDVPEHERLLELASFSDLLDHF